MNTVQSEDAKADDLAALDLFFAGVASGAIGIGASAATDSGGATTPTPSTNIADAPTTTPAEPTPETEEMTQALPDEATNALSASSPESAALPTLELLNPGDQLAHTGDTVNLNLHVDGGTGEQLQFLAFNLPPGLNVDENTGIVSGTIAEDAAGDYGNYYEVYLYAGNSQDQWTGQAIWWTVLPQTADNGTLALEEQSFGPLEETPIQPEPEVSVDPVSAPEGTVEFVDEDTVFDSTPTTNTDNEETVNADEDTVFISTPTTETTDVQPAPEPVGVPTSRKVKKEVAFYVPVEKQIQTASGQRTVLVYEPRTRIEEYEVIEKVTDPTAIEKVIDPTASVEENDLRNKWMKKWQSDVDKMAKDREYGIVGILWNQSATAPMTAEERTLRQQLDRLRQKDTWAVTAEGTLYYKPNRDRGAAHGGPWVGSMATAMPPQLIDLHKELWDKELANKTTDHDRFLRQLIDATRLDSAIGNSTATLNLLEKYYQLDLQIQTYDKVMNNMDVEEEKTVLLEEVRSFIQGERKKYEDSIAALPPEKQTELKEKAPWLYTDPANPASPGFADFLRGSQGMLRTTAIPSASLLRIN